MTPHRILVTGSAGAIGRPVCAALRARGHFVRGFDLAPSPTADEDRTGSITEPADLDAAVESMDTLIHLAAEPDENDFMTRLLPLNVVGLYHAMEAARNHNLRRVVLASSMQAGGRRDEQGVLRVDGHAPHNHYAVTKLMAENMGQMYHLQHGMSVVAVRIGWFTRNVREAQHLKSRSSWASFLSHDDAGRFFVAAVEAEPVGFTTVFAVSKQDASGRRVDLAPARALGYEPQDAFPHGLPFEVP